MQFRQLIKRLTTRSFDRVFLRLYTISKRYGWTPERYCRHWMAMIHLCKKYGFTPTFPVTASVVARHPDRFRAAQDLGVEFAVHGLKHIDYTQLSPDSVKMHADEAKQLFNLHGIQATGFRYPYLRHNVETVQCIASSGYGWDSSRAVVWSGIEETHFSPAIWSNYQAILSTYHAEDYNSHPSLPRWEDGFVHLPVAIPDDDVLIERLELRCPEEITAILSNMYEDYVSHGYFLTLQLHPERFTGFAKSLESIMSKAEADPQVWVTSLNEMATWWLERSQFSIKAHPLGENTWQIQIQAPKDSTIELWAQSKCLKQWKEHTWQATYQPIIHVTQTQLKFWESILRNEGFAFTVNASGEDCALTLPERKQQAARCDLYKAMEINSNPVLRISTWPGEKRAAVAVSGDIDGIDRIDFWERFRGN